MNIIDATTAPESPNPHGVSTRGLHGTEHVQVVMVTMQPGEALKLHVTPVDAFFYVLQGHGVVEIGDEREKVSPDMLIDSPARYYTLNADKNMAQLRILVVKTPRQTNPAKIL